MFFKSKFSDLKYRQIGTTERMLSPNPELKLNMQMNYSKSKEGRCTRNKHEIVTGNWTREVYLN